MKLQYPLIAAVAAFVGCTSIPSVGPSYEEPDIKEAKYLLPDAGMPTTNLTETCEYQAANSNEDIRVVISDDVMCRWWTRFNDPVLEQLINSAVTNNLSFRMAQERLDRARYELLGSYAAFMPKFSVNGSWTRGFYGKKTRTSSGKNLYTVNTTQATLDGTWEIDIFGGSRRMTEAAIAEAEAAGWTVADAWLALTTQIGESYINLRTTQSRLVVARRNLKLQSETYEILKSRFDSGIGDELAVNQCAYVVEQTRAAIPQMLAQEESLKNAISILAGDRAGAMDKLLAPLPEDRDWLLAPQKIAELPLDWIRSRPDVKIAERNLAAATARIGVAKAQWFPRLYLNGSVGWQTYKKARLFSTDSFMSTLGPAISWPILQGGSIYANVKAMEASCREAALNYELAVDNAYAGVRNSYSEYTQEYHRYQSLQAAVKAAADAVSISKDLYKNGLKDFNNVLDAQRSLLQLDEQLVISRGQITLDLIDLYKSLGGGLSSMQ